MLEINISGQKRSDLGKKATRQLRSEDQVPAVIYGGTETIHFSAPVIAFRTLVYMPDFQLAEITVDGKTYKTIMKDLQFDVVTDDLNHIDFLELVEDRKVNATLPKGVTPESATLEEVIALLAAKAGKGKTSGSKKKAPAKKVATKKKG